MRQRTSLYRHYAKDGSLLYVGISLNHVARLADHSSVSSWFWDIARVDVEHFPSRSAAKRAEANAIRDETPAYNQRGGGPGLCSEVSAECAEDVSAIWHDGRFLTAAIISYCKNKYDLEVSRVSLAAEFGEIRWTRDLSKAERSARMEFMEW